MLRMGGGEGGGVGVGGQWQTDVSHSSLSPLLSHWAWILISAHPSPSCLIFSTISQLNQPTNRRPTSSAIIDHSQLLLPLKMFCWSLENQHVPSPVRCVFSLEFQHSVVSRHTHTQFTPNTLQVTLSQNMSSIWKYKTNESQLIMIMISM